MSTIKRIVAAALLIAVAIWLNNTSHFTSTGEDRRYRFISHRGVHQIYAGDDRSNDSCHATPLKESNHTYIENTVASMGAAFDHGADVVEVDIHRTVDNVFAVFHDWRLECRTDGVGVTREQTFDYLQTLDVGYNYSVEGSSFPLRGSGVGQIPSLTEVLHAFPDGKFLLNIKTSNVDEGTHLAKMLENEEFRKQVFGVYGGTLPTDAVIAGTQGLKGFHRPGLKACAKDYMLFGWTGLVPSSCTDTIIAVPIDYAKYLWGWPGKFMRRMKRANTEVILLGPYDGSGHSSGIDDTATLSRVPDDFDGYVWTNRIEILGRHGGGTIE